MSPNDTRVVPLAQVFQPGTIFFNLVLPVTEVGISIFRFDPLEKMLGRPLAYILEPAMRAPVYRRPSQAGPGVNVFPLHLPPGEAISIKLGNHGDIGFGNDSNYLRIIAPWAASNWLTQRLAPWMVRGPERGVSVDGTAYVAMVWVRLEPGMSASMPIPVLGEIGVEVG